jgi:SHS2 domain-containing protein
VIVELHLPQPFTPLEHTADAGVEVHGASAAEALARLVLALAQLESGGGAVEATVERELAVPAADELAVVAIDLLRAVHALFVLEQLIPASVAVLELDESCGARVRLRLGLRDPARHGEGLDVKAVTYHAMALGPDGAGGFVARAVVDL